MNLIELNRALRQLRLGGIAAVLETRLHQAQAEAMPPIDFLSCLVSDELTRRGDRLLERRTKQAEFRDPQRTLDNFDFNFNKKMNRSCSATDLWRAIIRFSVRCVSAGTNAAPLSFEEYDLELWPDPSFCQVRNVDVAIRTGVSLRCPFRPL
jgi:hypothetical protein